MSSIQLQTTARDILIDPTWAAERDRADKRYMVRKDEMSRVGNFADWLDMTGRRWHEPDLGCYRDHLLYDYQSPKTGKPLAPATVQSHLSTIRGRYRALLEDNGIRDRLYAMTPADASPADKKAFVEEMLIRLSNNVQPRESKVKLVTEQDVEESKHLRLKPHQMKALQQAPGTDSLKGLRDTALLVLMSCTGIREAELAALDVDDLRQELNGELALRVKAGKGMKKRLVPYGPLDWCLLYVDRWLAAAGIEDGAVFRGFYKDNKHVRPARLSGRTVIRIVTGYPISIDGKKTVVNVHDLRRSYARNAYENGMDVERIRQNLGHANIKTTQGYIGTLDADQRRPPAMYDMPDDIDELSQRWMLAET